MDIQKILSNASAVMGSIKGDKGGDPGDGKKIKLSDSAKLKSGEYSKDTITNWAKASQAVGVDPYQMIALGWQEGNLSEAVKQEERVLSTGRKVTGNRNGVGQVKDFSEAQLKELTKLSADSDIPQGYLKAAIAFRDKLKYAEQLGFKDEAMKLQAYNGYGKIMPQKDASGKVIPTKMYGQVVPETGLDMRKTPLYGNRLIALKKDLQSNKELAALIGQYNTKAAPVTSAPSAILAAKK